MFQWFSRKPSESHKLLDPSGLGIVSASCCSPLSFRWDETLVTNLKEALAQEGLSPPIHFETISAAHRGLRSGTLNQSQAETLDDIVYLFASSGLMAFPVLLIGGKIAFSGTPPSVDAIREKLRAIPLTPAAPVPGGEALSSA